MDAASISPVLHDGVSCRQHGCSEVVCGCSAELFGSQDLDHFPWTFISALCRHERVKQGFGAKFVKDPDAWSAAVIVHGDAIFRIVNLDLSTAMQMECLFPAAPTSAGRQILTSCAIVWEAAMTLIGYCAGLVMVKPLQRTPKNSCNVKQAFHALVRAVKVQGKHPVAATGITALSHAREEYRAAVKKHKHDVQTFRAQRYMQLCTQKATLAEIFLAKCLRKNKPGLPDIMMDVAGSRLERAAVPDKAATYIENMQELTPTADLPHGALVECQCLETRSLLRTSVDRSPAAFVLDEDVMKKTLHQLDVAAECRGLPYAALLVQSHAFSMDLADA